MINSIKRRANIPDSQNMISNDEILDFANEEMELTLVPLIVSKHEDYYLVSESTPLVSSKSRYSIPYRSIGNKLQDVAYQDSGGKQHFKFLIY